MHRASQVRRERFFRRGSRKAREIAPSRPDDHPQQCRDSHMVAGFVVGGASMVWIAVVEGLLNHEFRDFDFVSMCKVQEHRHLSQQDIGVTAPASDAETFLYDENPAKRIARLPARWSRLPWQDESPPHSHSNHSTSCIWSARSSAVLAP